MTNFVLVGPDRIPQRMGYLTVSYGKETATLDALSPRAKFEADKAEVERLLDKFGK